MGSARNGPVCPLGPIARGGILRRHFPCRDWPMLTTWIVKGFIVLVLLVIITSLTVAMIALVRDKGQSNKTLKALTVRISLSIALFIFVMIAIALGLITPHGM